MLHRCGFQTRCDRCICPRAPKDSQAYSGWCPAWFPQNQACLAVLGQNPLPCPTSSALPLFLSFRGTAGLPFALCLAVIYGSLVPSGRFFLMARIVLALVTANAAKRSCSSGCFEHSHVNVRFSRLSPCISETHCRIWGSVVLMISHPEKFVRCRCCEHELICQDPTFRTYVKIVLQLSTVVAVAPEPLLILEKL